MVKSNTPNHYPQDEFDEIVEGPVGLHRGQPSTASRVVPYILMILLVAVTLVAIWIIGSGELPWDSSKSQETTQSASKQEQNSASHDDDKKSEEKARESVAESAKKSADEESKKANEEKKQEDKQTADETADQPNRATSVMVLNTTNVAGLARNRAQPLQNSGYTDVTPDNAAKYNYQNPEGDVVWYTSDADKATAEDVAKAMGITNVVQKSDIAKPIVVLVTHQ